MSLSVSKRISHDPKIGCYGVSSALNFGVSVYGTISLEGTVIKHVNVYSVKQNVHTHSIQNKVLSSTSLVHDVKKGCDITLSVNLYGQCLSFKDGLASDVCGPNECCGSVADGGEDLARAIELGFMR